MKILYVAQEPQLDRSQIATGNAIRAAQLTRSIEAAGHLVTHIWLNTSEQPRAGGFRNSDELHSLLVSHAPDVVLVSYWELLDLLPFDYERPVILDFVAPRPLEDLFEDPGQVQHNLRRLRLLILTLLDAGFDLRNEIPVVCVPLAAETTGGPLTAPGEGGWTLVSGGVSWPWRNAEPWWTAINSVRGDGANALNLVLFGGQYRLHEDGDKKAAIVTESRPMEPYKAFSAYLSESAHIGLELADKNIERRYSQSFRSLEFLRHGLPLICNRYLPIATLVAQYDAGWLVDDPVELPGLLREIMADPAGWQQKSANARSLVDEQLAPATAAAPLIDWLHEPVKATRLECPEADVPALATLPPLKRMRRMANLGLWVLKRRVFLWMQKRFGGRAADGIVLVSRGDLFPADHGAAVKIVETARGLSRLGRPVALVTDDRQHWWRLIDGELQREKLPLWVRMLALPMPLTKLLHLSKDIPESNAFLYLPLSDSSFFWRTLWVGSHIKAGVLQAEFPAYVQPCLRAGHILESHIVLVEHNVEYERLRAQVPELTEPQYQRFRGIEIQMCNQSDAVICVSDNDRQQLAVDGVDPEKLHTIPHGVDLAQYQLPAESSVRERFNIPPDAPILVYHGTFSYPPNLEALDVFANEILPRLDDLGLPCHVLAVGRNPPQKSLHPRIHCPGSVDLVAPWLKAADLAVVPLLEGGGTRMKIIDYFAAGIPVISTAKGIEGIPAINGRHALIMDQPDQIAAAISDLLRDTEQARKLAEAAQELAAPLDWKSIAGTYLALFERL
jgi:glycosyltransferase involved in cell wall biosynthesis